MTPAKIYSNKSLFEIFSRVVETSGEYLKSAEVVEAIRMRKRGLNPDSVHNLAGLDEAELKDILGAVRQAEEVAKTTNVVPHLYDL